MGKLIGAILLLFVQTANADIQPFSNKVLHVKSGLGFPGYDLQFKSKENTLQFNPNLRALLYVSASFEGLFGASYGFRMSQNQKDKEQMGDSSYQDYRFNFAFRQLLLNVSWSKMAGFYVKDTKAIDPSWTSGSPFYQANNLSATTAVANLTWVFSPEQFSLEAAIDQTKRQATSGGSWLLGAALGQTTFRDDKPIIPASIQSSYGDQAQLESGRFNSLVVKAGYGYALIVQSKFFLSGALQVGFGPQWSNLTVSGDQIFRRQNAAKLDALISLGYNGDDNYAGLSFLGDNFTYPTGAMEISSLLHFSSVFFGMRF